MQSDVANRLQYLTALKVMKFRPSPSSSRRSLLASAVELLRDHAVFQVPVPGEDVPSLLPEDRENAWSTETLHLFRRRMKIVSLAAMLSAPLFWAFSTWVSPHARGAISLTQSVMLLMCIALYLASSRINSIRPARLLTMVAYIVFGVTAAAVMIESKDPRVIAFSGHGQIIISILFMPFLFVEAGLCAAVVTLAFGLGLFYALPEAQHNIVLPRALSLGFTGFIMAFMAHLQSLVRRRAFEAAFDMAVSASRGAHLSNSDFLTGGANRRHFETTVTAELARATRSKRPLSLVLFDLDGFKKVNDTFGHAGGDEVLREVFRAAQDTVRGSDVLARFGGDEFALALPEADGENAFRTAERLREAVARHLNALWGEGSVQARVTLSMGVTCVSGESCNLTELIGRADAALYQAKHNGKNCVVVG